MTRNAMVDERAPCPIDFAADSFGDRWTFLILRDLVLAGKHRYSEFLASREGIATNILATRLKRLEAAGLIERFPDPDNRRQVLYCPTDRAIDLIPVLVEFAYWSAKHGRGTVLPLVPCARYRSDRKGLLAELRQTARLRQRTLKRRTRKGSGAPADSEAPPAQVRRRASRTEARRASTSGAQGNKRGA